ncbi:MAG: DUF1800 family protein, partial [Verrucomicrobia bacterium]|nr:DUF1800 family protein [Verrucomicrobiota bacterium]
GAIIFDLDDAPLIDGAYHWTFEPTGALTVADILHAIKNGNAYLNVHSSRYPAGEIRGTYALAAGSQTFSPPPPPPALPGGLPTAQEAARFLAQATFGPTSNAIAEVQASGYAAWLDQQFDLPPSQHLPLVDAFYAANTNADATANTTFNAWWERAVTAPDQLRQRVAFALSEILVVSREDADLEVQPVGLSAYYDLLLTNAFGNFRQLLEEATLSPAMGDYLDMRRNDKPDQVTGRYPNENYAREVLQLFSIGLRKLHPDGTLKISSEGLPIPTYSQDEIVGFAHTFTGWTYFSTNQNWSAGANFRLPMTWVASHHDTGEKRVLDNVVLAAGQSAAADLDQALDNIFENPNVGPFLCRILIQRLVCSNPSPAYVYRVTRAFEDNGAGVRGDLRAVVRAILLDYEARSASFLAAQGYGKQREPVLRVSTIVRAFGGGSTNGFTMNGTDFDLQQTPIAAPTVFNFYEPDYIAPGDLAGAGLFAPEFQITSETSVIRSHNFLRSGLFSARGYKNTLYLDLSAQQALAGNVPELVEQLNQLLLAGQMSVGLRGVVTNYVNTISAAQTLDRARSAIHLVVTSPEFSIQK